MPEQEQVSRGKVFGCDVETRCPSRHRINYGPSQLPPAKGVPKLGMILLPALRDPWGLDDPVPSVPSVHVQTSNGSPPIRPVATPFCKVGLGAQRVVPAVETERLLSALARDLR
jgi:hypothetical protein